jgi:rubrerythrin
MAILRESEAGGGTSDGRARPAGAVMLALRLHTCKKSCAKLGRSAAAGGAWRPLALRQAREIAAGAAARRWCYGDRSNIAARPTGRREMTMPAKVDFATLSLMDTLDLATLIEVEASQRYALFAEQIGSGTEAGDFFAAMIDNETKHADELAERRRALFGEAPARIRPEDLFDVEAPDVGWTHRNMSAFKACQVALAAERKAHDFYDGALRRVTEPAVRALFEELRAEEAEHVRMVEAIIARLPAESKVDLEDEDDTSMRMGF